MTDRVGQYIDDYRLIRLLGTGAFGEVYLGEHLDDQTLVAVKMLSLNQGNWKEFVKEAGTTFRLKHPHIIPLLAFGISPDDIPYLIMDYAPNGTLRQRHPQGTCLPLETIVSYLVPLAEALQYAHERRVIHRDVKPDNVLIGQNGEVLLSDFGIAIIAPIEQSLNTQNLEGTAPYIAPEQIRGKPQPASDQYAIAVMVYEWLCGVRPFHGTVWELLDQHRSQSPVPLRQLRPDLPPMVEEIILKALAKDPRERFATIQEFATALELAYRGKTRFQLPAGNTALLSGSVEKAVQMSHKMLAVTSPPTSLPAPSEPSSGPSVNGQCSYPNRDQITALPLQATPVAPQTPWTLQRYCKQYGKRIAIIIPLLLILIFGSILYAFRSSLQSAGTRNTVAGHHHVGNILSNVTQPSPTATGSVMPTVVPLTPTVDSQPTNAVPQAIIPTQTPVAETAAAPPRVVAQVTATAQVSTPQELYSAVTGQPPSFSDSLVAQSARNWSTTSTCTFSDGKYIISSPAGYFQPCIAVGTNLCNLGYQVQMTTLGGDGGGLIFRDASNQYRLRVSPNGSYDLVNASVVLTSGSSGAIHQGINVTNQLTIIAQGSKIYLYVNAQYITSVTDQASSCGTIGLMAVGFTSAGKAAFSNATIWSL